METRKLCSVYASAIPSISFCCYNLQKWLRLNIHWTYSEEIQCLSSTKAWFFLIKVTLTPKFTSDKPFTQKAGSQTLFPPHPRTSVLLLFAFLLTTMPCSLHHEVILGNPTLLCMHRRHYCMHMYAHTTPHHVEKHWPLPCIPSFHLTHTGKGFGCRFTALGKSVRHAAAASRGRTQTPLTLSETNLDKQVYLKKKTTAGLLFTA